MSQLIMNFCKIQLIILNNCLVNKTLMTLLIKNVNQYLKNTWLRYN